MAPGRRDELGHFPRSTSIARRVMEERVVALYHGQRASLVGALEALAFVGTTLHTYSGGGKLYARMLRTATSFEIVWHGSRSAADEELARVQHMHEEVSGRIGQDIAPQYPAGTTYSAFDPWLSYMTMAFLADSSRAIFEAFVRPLTRHELEAWWRDWLRFGEMYGMTRSYAPATYGEFREQFDGWLHSDAPHLTDRARRAGMTLLDVELPSVLQPLNWIARLVVVGTVEPRVRDAYGLDWTRRDQLAFDGLARASRALRPVTPRRVATGRLTPLGNALLPYAEARLTSRVAAARARREAVSRRADSA